MYKQIGILTGGGDAPGLNAVIRSVVRTATGRFGMKCVGIDDSFEGILGELCEDRLRPVKQRQDAFFSDRRAKRRGSWGRRCRP